MAYFQSLQYTYKKDHTSRNLDTCFYWPHLQQLQHTMVTIRNILPVKGRLTSEISSADHDPTALPANATVTFQTHCRVHVHQHLGRLAINNTDSG